MDASIRPKGILDFLSQQEIRQPSDPQNGGLNELFRRCALAVLNSDSQTDSGKEMLAGFPDFSIKVVQQTRSIKLELRNAPPKAFVNGELIQGRTFPVDRSPREPWYDSDTMSQNVFDPNGPPVEIPNGGWDVESRISSGGLVGSARSIVEFLDVYQTAGDGIGTRRRGAEGSGSVSYTHLTLPTNREV